MSVRGFRLRLKSAAAGGCAVMIAGGVLLMFLGVGSLMTIMMVREVIQRARAYGWPEVTCEIISSSTRIDEKNRDAGRYAFEVEYRYAYEGETYSSRQYRLQPKVFSDMGYPQRLILRYQPGTQAVCYVNPDQPGEAILERESLWLALLIPFPLIFVVIGGGGLIWGIRHIRRSKRKGSKTASVMEQAKSAKAGGTRKVGLIIFGVFLVLGGVGFYFLGFLPAVHVIAARGWKATPCEVISSRVRSHHSDDGTTYSVDILYRYKVNGREFQSSRYDFSLGSSSGSAGKRAIVRRYPSGFETVCFVNHRDPVDAVLMRGFVPSMLFGLIPLMFLLVGAGGVLHGLRAARRDRLPGQPRHVSGTAFEPGVGTGQRDAPTGADQDRLPRTLKPTISSLGKLLGALFFAVFWNGIVSVFIWQAVQGWSRGRPDWFLTLFLVPFVLVGLIVIVVVFYMLLELFNARPQLTVTPGAVPLGTSLEVRWELRGRTSSVRRLRLRLEGREETRYQRGTTTYTDKSVFYRQEVIDTTDRMTIVIGQTRMDIPANLMHSFAADNNKIIWSLHVHGEIARWPDIKLEFPITVLPHALQAETRSR